MAAGGVDNDLKYMEALQVFEYMPDEEQVEPLSDMIAKVLKRCSSDRNTTSAVAGGHRGGHAACESAVSSNCFTMEQVSVNPVALSCDGVMNCDALCVFRVEGE